MTKISRVKAKSVIEGFGNKIFKVRFVKKDGAIREMSARLGVKSHLRGGRSTITDEHSSIVVFDMQKKEYRCINLDTLEEIKCGNKHYEVV